MQIQQIFSSFYSSLCHEFYNTKNTNLLIDHVASSWAALVTSSNELIAQCLRQLWKGIPVRAGIFCKCYESVFICVCFPNMKWFSINCSLSRSRKNNVLIVPVKKTSKFYLLSHFMTISVLRKNLKKASAWGVLH